MKEPKQDYRAIGVLAVAAGLFANVGIVEPLVMLGCAPIAVISGIVAIRKKHKVLGWIGVALGSAAIITNVYLFYHWGWFSPTHND